MLGLEIVPVVQFLPTSRGDRHMRYYESKKELKNEIKKAFDTARINKLCL